MLSNRSILLATACLLPFSLVACGGSDSKSGDDGGSGTSGPTPAGAHYQYVVNKVNVPMNTGAGDSPVDYGLDLGSSMSSKPDGTVDNQLGNLLATISGLFPVQATIDTAIDQGSITLLVDFQTTDFTTAAGAGFTVKFGTNPMPAACASATDTVCGNQLKGTATFSIDANSPSDAALVGTVSGGTFNSNAGNVSVAIALGAGTPIDVSLVHARVKAMGISATAMTSVNVGGLVTMTELQNTLAPAIATAVNNELVTAGGCDTMHGTFTATPQCGCMMDTTVTGVIYGLFDANKDCSVSAQEILSSQTASRFLTPDSCSMDTCTAPDSISLGVNVTAVPAMFPSS